MDEITELKRGLSLPLITFYGLGSIIGAGIYVLIGQVAGIAGLYAPIAFILAAIIAGFTAFSYAELSSRYPVSAGEARYILEGLRLKWLATLAGWLVVVMGIMSASTLARGFVGYFHLFLNWPNWLIITLFVISLGVIAIWGITESAILAAIITLLEVAGLIFVLIVAGHNFQTLPQRLPELIPPLKIIPWIGILTGTFIAFFAYIGFEDMVNVAEEVKEVKRNLPIGIFFAVGISTVLYILVALIAILSLPIHELANNTAPLALIVQKTSHISPSIIGIISLIAIINGALLQFIMASRVIYGLGKQNGAPKFLTKVNKKTQTPIRATLLVTFIILGLTLLFPIETLAKSSSFFTLSMFTLINLSLMMIKIKKTKCEGAACYPIFMPIIALILTSSLLILQCIIMIKSF